MEAASGKDNSNATAKLAEEQKTTPPKPQSSSDTEAADRSAQLCGDDSPGIASAQAQEDYEAEKAALDLGKAALLRSQQQLVHNEEDLPEQENELEDREAWVIVAELGGP